MAKKRSSTSLFPHPRLVEDWFAAVLRSTRGPVVESRLCQIIHEAFPRQFVKSLEYAPVDSALFQEELFGSDQHTLERHADLAQRPQMPEFIPIEFKSFLPHTSVPWEYRWGCSLRRDSVDHGIIIFASTADPQRVALVPASTLAPRLKKKKGPPNARHMIDLGTAKLPHQRAAPPFPYGIQPYVMPVSELPGALRHLLACAGGAGGIWHNPSTQSHFRGSIPQTSSDRSLLRRGGASEDTICELHEWFRDSGGGHQVRLNALAPLLGDFHLVGEGEDRRHFVELKAGGLKVDCDSVSQCTARKRKGRMVPFFNWRGQADWLLSTPQTSSMPYALMMPMRDLPREWRDASYGGIDSASTPIRGVRPYLLPWPQGGRQGPPAFCSDIEGCLQQAAGTIQGKDADHLRHLSRSAVEDIIEGEETEPEDDEQQGKAAAKNPNREYQRWYESKAARALNMILVKSCRAVLVDAGPDCTIARYFVCARRLLPTAIDDAASFSDISRLSPHTMLAPLRFIRIKSGSAEHYKSAVHYDLKGHVPCPLVFDSWDPNDLMAPHTRRVADSVNFGDAISLHGGVVPDFPLTWEECEMVEIEGDERNIVTRLLGCFQTGDARTSSIMPASMEALMAIRGSGRTVIFILRDEGGLCPLQLHRAGWRGSLATFRTADGPINPPSRWAMLFPTVHLGVTRSRLPTPLERHLGATKQRMLITPQGDTPRAFIVCETPRVTQLSNFAQGPKSPPTVQSSSLDMHSCLHSQTASILFFVSNPTLVDRRMMAYERLPETPFGLKLNQSEHCQRRGWQWNTLPDLEKFEVGWAVVTGFPQGRLELAEPLVRSTAEKHLYDSQYIGSAILAELLPNNRVLWLSGLKEPNVDYQKFRYTKDADETKLCQKLQEASNFYLQAFRQMPNACYVPERQGILGHSGWVNQYRPLARHQRLHAHGANLSSSQEVVPVTIIYDQVEREQIVLDAESARPGGCQNLVVISGSEIYAGRLQEILGLPITNHTKPSQAKKRHHGTYPKFYLAVDKQHMAPFRIHSAAGLQEHFSSTRFNQQTVQWREIRDVLAKMRRSKQILSLLHNKETSKRTWRAPPDFRASADEAESLMDELRSGPFQLGGAPTHTFPVTQDIKDKYYMARPTPIGEQFLADIASRYHDQQSEETSTDSQDIQDPTETQDPPDVDETQDAGSSGELEDSESLEDSNVPKVPGSLDSDDGSQASKPLDDSGKPDKSKGSDGLDGYESEVSEFFDDSDNYDESEASGSLNNADESEDSEFIDDSNASEVSESPEDAEYLDNA